MHPRRAALALCLAVVATPAVAQRNAIFLHPDGMGANTWMGVRLLEAGPDGRIAFDELPNVAAYVGPLSDRITQSSNGGATTHAWGVRAQKESYGAIDGKPPAAARSGFAGSLMREAQHVGKAVGIVNSSSVTEPGTGAFLASVANRDDEAEIAAQILAAKPEVALGGGEMFFLPEGVRGRHGVGVRTDGRNLVEEARAAGYTVVFTADELEALPVDTPYVLGLFAAEETFNEGTEEGLRKARLAAFQPQAPRFDAMIVFAIARLSRDADGFLLVGNEEATDNFGGENNASAVFDAGAGADRAVRIALDFAQRQGQTTVVVASDSDCGGLLVTGDDVVAGQKVAPRGENGSPQDGGPDGLPFLAAPNRAGVRLPFIATWASASDSSGGVMARGYGPGADLVRGTIDSIDIYRALYLGLFERRID
ncbi:MAG: alkaline phosphatase [Xanthomonadaceae bacterium]|jgi:alkaline phosphatase|nr:alkaline phosphatase [Xanthomonadaceae bacterium]